MSRYHPDLLDEIETFLARHEVSATTFGRLAMNDPHFMRDIRGDRCLRPESVMKVRAFMRERDTATPAPASPGKDDVLTASQQSEAA